MALYDYILPDFKVTENIDFGSINKQNLKEFLIDYTQNYFEASDNSEWFGFVKSTALNHNFADMKDYKKSPESYAGSVADAVKFVRFAITGRTNTPELHTIMKTISKQTCIERLNDFLNNKF